MPRKRIAIDMDEVMAQVVPKFLRLYEDTFGVKPETSDYHGKKLYQLPGSKQLREALFHKGFFRDLPVMPDSQEVIRELMEEYDIFIVTAAMEFRNSFEDKFDWLREHFDFIPWKNIIFCGDKSIIDADYMIDDHAFNLETFKGKGLLFTATHNVDENRFERVNGWLEVRAFFEKERAEASE
ncbi:MAG: 5'(3')-deoxyribonucleotidase [Bacteroidetes bacterium]|nr:5'(3')-deoxyribonucleotidase [Bacteroidota bacterium]